VVWRKGGELRCVLAGAWCCLAGCGEFKGVRVMTYKKGNDLKMDCFGFCNDFKRGGILGRGRCCL